jgi:hypothetical protein
MSDDRSTWLDGWVARSTPLHEGNTSMDSTSSSSTSADTSPPATTEGNTSMDSTSSSLRALLDRSTMSLLSRTNISSSSSRSPTDVSSLSKFCPVLQLYPWLQKLRSVKKNIASQCILNILFHPAESYHTFIALLHSVKKDIASQHILKYILPSCRIVPHFYCIIAQCQKRYCFSTYSKIYSSILQNLTTHGARPIQTLFRFLTGCPISHVPRDISLQVSS